MRYIGWIGIVTGLAAGATAASCIPDFQFASETDGDAGAGAGGGAVADGPIVPCGADGGDCQPGEVCCYHTTVVSCDMCSTTIECVGDPLCDDAGTYAVFLCNNAEDCAAGKRCCMTYTGPMTGIQPQGSQCQPACADNQLPLCHQDGSCDPLPADAGPDAGTPTCHGLGYPGYRVCY